MDNAAIHHANIVMDVCVERFLIPWFLPPYSPEYQPIEHVFSVTKNMYRKQPLPLQATMTLVAGRVLTSLGTLTSVKMHNTFEHCWAFKYPA